MSRVDVALVGCGHMGRHHARVIAAHPRCRLVAAIDVVDGRAAEIAGRYGAEARTSVPEGVAAVVIATPTVTHVGLGREHVAAGRWVLIEKPLAPTAADAALLRHGRVVVGHVERFNPSVRAAGAVRPQHVEARRLAPPTGRSMDVDVLLDLMVHDLDLVIGWCGDLVGFEVTGRAGRDGVDEATVHARTASGATATLVASRLAGRVERTVRVVETDRVTMLDLHARTAVRIAADGVPRPLPMTPEDGLGAQWDAFLRAVVGEAAPAVSADDGARAVAAAERIGAALVAPV